MRPGLGPGEGAPTPAPGARPNSDLGWGSASRTPTTAPPGPSLLGAPSAYCGPTCPPRRPGEHATPCPPPGAPPQTPLPSPGAPRVSGWNRTVGPGAWGVKPSQGYFARQGVCVGWGGGGAPSCRPPAPNPAVSLQGALGSGLVSLAASRIEVWACGFRASRPCWDPDEVLRRKPRLCGPGGQLEVGAALTSIKEEPRPCRLSLLCGAWEGAELSGGRLRPTTF